jgi:hypothetical protein
LLQQAGSAMNGDDGNGKMLCCGFESTMAQWWAVSGCRRFIGCVVVKGVEYCLVFS